MSTSRKTLFVIPLLIFVLACRAVMAPIEQAQDAGSTAVAFATEAGEIITQVSGFATEAGDFATQVAPLSTAMAMSTNESGIPGNFFNPQDPPLTEWNGIPVMPEAIAADESEGLYGYTIKVDVTVVQEFYADKLPDLGWTEVFTMPDSSGLSVLVYQKGSQMVTVTITTLEDHLLVMLTLQ